MTVAVDPTSVMLLSTLIVSVVDAPVPPAESPPPLLVVPEALMWALNSYAVDVTSFRAASFTWHVKV